MSGCFKITTAHQREIMPESSIASPPSLKTLIAKGKEQNYLTYAEVNDHLPESISDPDQVEDIIQMINDMGIKVYETAPDADQLLMNENENEVEDEVGTVYVGRAGMVGRMRPAAASSGRPDPAFAPRKRHAAVRRSPAGRHAAIRRLVALEPQTPPDETRTPGFILF